MTDGRELVVVTGASGFIAQHCVLVLLRAGYRVRGTVRNLARAESPRAALERLASPGDALEFVQAELDRDDGWDAAMVGATFVLHVASPLPGAPPKDDSVLITPAREGTLRVLRAASRAGVRRVVLTSSIAAIMHGTPREGTDLYDEDSWSDTSKDIGAYEKSKSLAERAAWEFVAGLPAEGRLELVTVNPGIVLGPVIDQHVGTSIGVVQRFLKRDLPGCARMHMTCVDVRDVAQLQLLAMTKEAAAGRRYLCTGESAWMVDLARILQKHFGPRGYAVPTRQFPDWMVRVVALYDKSAGLILKDLGVRYEFSHERASRELGWSPRGLEEMLIATGESLIEHGLV